MRILFFGLGAVGAVMAVRLQTLYREAGIEPVFAFALRRPKGAKAALFRAPKLLQEATLLPYEDSSVAAFKPDLIINASTPELNLHIAQLALKAKAHYADLASDIYQESVQANLTLPQHTLHKAFKAAGKTGVINLGFSPGLTNFIIGEKIKQIEAHKSDRIIRSIELFLLEELKSERILFSWSPKVALDELIARPAYFKAGTLHHQRPFSAAVAYPFDPAQPVETYPVFQEEILSLHRHYPQIEEIRLFCGGNEIELFKNLFQLNLLSRDLKVGSAPVEQVVRKVLPKMKSPKVVEHYSRRRIIKSARFEAVARITSTDASGHRFIESVGARFERFHDLFGTPFSGATYIAYPTGIAAAVLIFFALNQSNLPSGILDPEVLPTFLEPKTIEEIKHLLAEGGIDFFSHLHAL